MKVRKGQRMVKLHADRLEAVWWFDKENKVLRSLELCSINTLFRLQQAGTLAELGKNPRFACYSYKPKGVIFYPPAPHAGEIRVRYHIMYEK